MSIRREDKELIHNLALLGAILGACLCVFGTAHLSKRAHEQSQRSNEYEQTHAALAKLSSSEADPEAPMIVDPALIKQVQEQIQGPQPDGQVVRQSFWLGIPRWGFWGLCVSNGILGAIAGFSTIWLTGWAGSAFVYHLIRLLYTIIRKAAPNSPAAKSTVIHSPTGQSAFQRNENRILPTLIKLIFLLLLILSVLGAVVWHLAGI